MSPQNVCQNATATPTATVVPNPLGYAQTYGILPPQLRGNFAIGENAVQSFYDCMVATYYGADIVDYPRSADALSWYLTEGGNAAFLYPSHIINNSSFISAISQLLPLRMSGDIRSYVQLNSSNWTTSNLPQIDFGYVTWANNDSALLSRFDGDLTTSLGTSLLRPTRFQSFTGSALMSIRLRFDDTTSKLLATAEIPLEFYDRYDWHSNITIYYSPFYQRVRIGSYKDPMVSLQEYLATGRGAMPSVELDLNGSITATNVDVLANTFLRIEYPPDAPDLGALASRWYQWTGKSSDDPDGSRLSLQVFGTPDHTNVAARYTRNLIDCGYPDGFYAG